MLRAYKYRIYPTEEQKVMMAKTFGCTRYVYNWALEMRERTYREEKKNISEFEMKKLIVSELKHGSASWLKEVSATSLEFAVTDLYEGYNRFFRKQGNRPGWRRKYHRQHYHDRGTSPNGISVDFKRGLLNIPKIKNIPCVFHRRFKGRIKQVGVELLPSGRYNASILVENDIQIPTPAPIDPEKTLGIDTGLEHFAVLSDGQVYEATHYGRSEKRKLKLLNRRFNKKHKGSRQFRILKHRIAKLNEHIANCRHDHIHKITHYLACENQATTICVESLNVEGMKQNKHLAYSVDDASIGEFYRQLKYKCAWAGKNYIKIDRFAPSSKMCGHCGYVYKKLRLDEREWTCPECGTHHNRDLNAAVNIKHFGLSEYKTLPSERRKVTPVEQPLVDDRSSEPKKLYRCYTARRVRADEAGKVKDECVPMP